MTRSLVSVPTAHRDTDSGAILSDDGEYRYRLWRNWDYGQQMVFVMLNPSTADAHTDDATIRRCIGFAKREECAGLVVINLYAFRATKPSYLTAPRDPEGPENSRHWTDVLLNHKGPVVAAWGASAVRQKLPTSAALYDHPQQGWKCLGKTKYGAPCHPLYLPADTPLLSWSS